MTGNLPPIQWIKKQQDSPQPKSQVNKNKIYITKIKGTELNTQKFHNIQNQYFQNLDFESQNEKKT